MIKKAKFKNIKKEKRILKNKKGKSKSTKNIIATNIILSSLISLIFGAGAGFVVLKSHLSKIDLSQKIENQKNIEKTKETESPNLISEERAIVAVVEKASPSVVSIIVTKDVPKVSSFFSDPFFSDPFFNPFGSNSEGGVDSETETREIGGGTGFIISQDGYIITNRHVVDDEDADYTVMMNDGRKIEASVLARDAFIDIAILKIEEKNLPTVTLGNSDQLKIGQTVIAIGNSLGEFRNTVSKGIISGLKRDVIAKSGLGQTDTLDEVIQTDAAINPGNSGGPIISLSGQVMGVNVAMAQGAENIGFAIPINEVKRIYQSVKEHGKIVRPYLGVRYVNNSEEIAKENNIEYDYGAIIIRGQKRTDLAILPGSPADKASLVENDIILEIDGTKLEGKNNLAKTISKKNVGDEVVLKVLSKGKIKEIKVTLEEAG